MIVAPDSPGDPVFQVLDQAVDPLLQFGVDVLEHHSGSQFLLRADLGQQPFAHLDQLGAFRHQSSERAYLFRGQAASRLAAQNRLTLLHPVVQDTDRDIVRAEVRSTILRRGRGR